MSDDLHEPLGRLKTYAQQLSLATSVYDRGPATEDSILTRERLIVKFSDGRCVKIKNDIDEPEEGLRVKILTPSIYREKTCGGETSRIEDASLPKAADLIDEVHEKVGFFVDLTEEELNIAADLRQEDDMDIREIEKALMFNRIHEDEGVSHEEFLFASMVLNYRRAENAMVEEKPVYSGQANSIRRHLNK
jgi:hypothetical protein